MVRGMGDPSGAGRRENRIWFVRAGSAGSAVREFLEAGFVGIAWPEAGDLTGTTELGDIVARLGGKNPSSSRGTLTNWASMLRGLAHSMRRDDWVMTIDPVERMYWIGVVNSDYVWTPGSTLPHRRTVTWRGRVARSDLSEAALRSLGSISTVFRASAEASAEVLARLTGSPANARTSLDSKRPSRR